MSFTLPDLPYSHDALQPYMSRETLEFHHDKHHLAYVTNGNNLLKGSEFEGKSLEDIVKGSFGKNAGLFNNAGQHYNHLHFWQWMRPNGGGDKLPSRLEKQIIADFGSIAKMKEDFIQGGVTQFGSGWTWLAVKDGKIAVMKSANGESPLTQGGCLNFIGLQDGAAHETIMTAPFSIAEIETSGAGKIGICRLPGRFGDFPGDLAIIKAWSPAIIVSMAGTDEMAEFGAGNFARELATGAIEWAHFPVPDYGTPPESGLAEWPALAKKLHAILDQGGGVLAHCRAGLGRSGMIALRLMAERGEALEDALARLRAARPGAVETDAQFAWAAQGSGNI